MPMKPFKTDESQQWFELVYLVFFLAVCLGVLCMVKYDCLTWIKASEKCLYYAFIGGLLGGWTFDAKWFYRVTARGRNNQYKESWEEHKIFWRLLVPIISGVVALSFYTLVSTGFISVFSGDRISNRSALGIGFLFGYFSDSTIAKMGELVDTLWGNRTNADKQKPADDMAKK